MPSLLEPQFEPHYSTWKTTPSPENADTLLGAVKPVMHEALRTYGMGASDSPTLRSKAKALTLHALHTYDPNRAKLRTHLLTQLQGLRRLAAREEQPMRIPEQVGLDRIKLHAAENELRDTLGREPSDAELADHTSISRRRIGKIRNAAGAFAEGALTRIDDEGGSVWTPSVMSKPNEKVLETWMEAIYHDLDPINQSILEHSVGLHGRPVLQNQELARKLRLSPGAVSQRKGKIQEMLNEIHSTGLTGE